MIVTVFEQFPLLLSPQNMEVLIIIIRQNLENWVKKLGNQKMSSSVYCTVHTEPLTRGLNLILEKRGPRG